MTVRESFKWLQANLLDSAPLGLSRKSALGRLPLSSDYRLNGAFRERGSAYKVLACVYQINQITRERDTAGKRDVGRRFSWFCRCPHA